MQSTQPYPPPGDPLGEPAARVPLPPDLVRDLLARQILPEEEWALLPVDVRDEVARCQTPSSLLALLTRHRLLSDYQAGQVALGRAAGLILGGYRIINRLGAGGSGVVYLAEHIVLRRQVALKVVAFDENEEADFVRRFLIETRTAAQLNHPNVVSVFDAGRVRDVFGGALHFLAMEYLQGRNLHDLIVDEGPLPTDRACDLVSQVAGALDEAHRLHLVHRDVKPANVFVLAGMRAKLLDFGVARNFRSRMTERGLVLGTVDFMAPEQARDASAVDIRADVYGLGATLYWCLTGQTPFRPAADLLQALAQRATQPPPSLNSLRADLPSELDAVLRRMMALDPAERYPSPRAALQALFPFIRPGADSSPPGPAGREWAPEPAPGRHRVLVVDDEAINRLLFTQALRADGIDCEQAEGGREAIEALQRCPYDLILIDMQMPGMSGEELLRHLRESPPWPHLKVILTSGEIGPDHMAQLMHTGADDFLPKPFSLVQFRARVMGLLRLKDAQEQSDGLRRRLQATNDALEKDLLARDGDLVSARNVLVMALAKLVERRDFETGAHLLRLQSFCRILAEEAASLPAFHDQIDPPFVQTLECCVPLHDIGKVGVPDHVLFKPGPLTHDERLIMQQHTTQGADTLAEVARMHPYAPAFMQMATDIIRHHHERWDGSGYPDGLSGSTIPLAARLTALADVYDALRSRRVYKPALAHPVAVQMMTSGRGQFDPALLPVFERCAPRLAEVFDRLSG